MQINKIKDEQRDKEITDLKAAKVTLSTKKDFNLGEKLLDPSFICLRFFVQLSDSLAQPSFQSEFHQIPFQPRPINSQLKQRLHLHS